ncbi:aminodeoxychorismate lyase [Lysobacter pythonis]|uniref:Aminodeoxychorismate lyase n=1 Tax=Solilutibacter pythonis TaxID=2483112 RepID=A0A3M2HSN9_9GAMM|nr:aminodeoxychorismate lyase [Lysobacter pythonis]RMH90843.1 aminodeoxychorismate lyase [Lysobacter pythonis]
MTEAAVRLFLGDTEVASIAFGNRAFAYGESLFETMRAHRGDIPWWEPHMTRLAEGAGRLAMPLPALDRVDAEARKLLDGENATLKLHLSRGGARGYAADRHASPFWMLSRHPLPTPRTALDIIHCRTRLSAQPLLAGLKHGNRLEQVLARAEVEAAHADEGLMRDATGHLISATTANLFALIGGEWRTPALDRCGVAGVMRGWLLTRAEARIAPVTQAELEQAEAVFLCNAVRGILPVRRLGDRTWPALHPATHALQAQLADAHPGFAHPKEIP